MAAWLNLISIIVFCCDRTSGFTRLTWLVITQCIEWQQIKFHGGHFSGLDFALSTSNMPILIMIWKRFLNRHKVKCKNLLWKHFCILVYRSFWFKTSIECGGIINLFRNDYMITWSFSKNSPNSRTFLLENELFFAFRLNYFKNSICFPFLAEFLSAENFRRKWCEYELIFDWQFQHV